MSEQDRCVENPAIAVEDVAQLACFRIGMTYTAYQELKRGLKNAGLEIRKIQDSRDPRPVVALHRSADSIM